MSVAVISFQPCLLLSSASSHVCSRLLSVPVISFHLLLSFIFKPCLFHQLPAVSVAVISFQPCLLLSSSSSHVCSRHQLPAMSVAVISFQPCLLLSSAFSHVCCCHQFLVVSVVLEQRGEPKWNGTEVFLQPKASLLV